LDFLTLGIDPQGSIFTLGNTGAVLREGRKGGRSALRLVSCYPNAGRIS